MEQGQIRQGMIHNQLDPTLWKTRKEEYKKGSEPIGSLPFVWGFSDKKPPVLPGEEKALAKIKPRCYNGDGLAAASRR